MLYNGNHRWFPCILNLPSLCFLFNICWISFYSTQLYRLTWCSRHSQEPRVDLQGPQMTSDCSPEPSHLPNSRWCRGVLCLCGLTESSLGSSPPVTENSGLISIQEKPLWRRVCNVNALLLLTVNVFLWGFWAWCTCRTQAVWHWKMHWHLVVYSILFISCAHSNSFEFPSGLIKSVTKVQSKQSTWPEQHSSIYLHRSVTGSMCKSNTWKKL